jgi:hypothetical protein
MFDLSTPTLNQFCLHYDWSYESYFFYYETSNCTQFRDKDYYVECLLGAITQVDISDLQEAIVAKLQCNMFSFYRCDIEIRKLFALNEIARNVKIINSTLYDYTLFISGLSSSTKIVVHVNYLPFLTAFVIYVIFNFHV